MADEIHEARGVRWTYLDPEDVEEHFYPNAVECSDCGRWFEASVYKMDGRRGGFCPECSPVESIKHSLERTLEEADLPPVQLDVADLMDAGDPR